MISSEHAALEPAPGLLAALRVPAFLIVLGGIFLVEDHWGWPVSRTWPILLIVWGALLIAARSRDSE